MFYRKFSLLLVLLIILTQISFSQTRSGKITENETWRGEINLTGDVVVTKSGRLTILPGTTVTFQPKRDDQISGYDKNLIELIIDGELIADGTQNSPITFTSSSSEKRMGDWFGIVIQNRKSTTSIRNAVVEYGFDGITIIASKPNIFSNVIQYNFNSGITCKINANPKIYDNTIFANGWAGVFSTKKAKPVLSGNRISLNDYGIIVMKSGEANLGNIDGTGADNNPGQNLIIGNNAFAMDNHSKYPIYAQNNTWAGPDNTPTQDISELIFDAKDNPGSGEVIYLPVFGDRQQPIAVEQPSDNEDPDLGPAAIAANQNQNLTNDRNQELVNNTTDNTQPQESENTDNETPINLGQAGAGAALLAVDNTAKSATVASDKTIEEKPRAPKEIVAEPVESGPVAIPVARKGPAQEWQVDQRRRQYVGSRPQPEYPRMALQTKTTGQVIIELVVDEKGKVINSRVLKTDSEIFNEAALEAANSISYQPMTISGDPVQVKLIERYIFNVR